MSHATDAAAASMASMHCPLGFRWQIRRRHVV